MAKLVKEFKKPISGETVLIGPESDEDIIIMALESSCDETACAIVKNGREVLANVVASQIKTHRLYGGVVPEVAAREHLDAVNLIIQEAWTSVIWIPLSEMLKEQSIAWKDKIVTLSSDWLI